jgi:hypothetical protein
MPLTQGLFCALLPPWYSPPHASSALACLGKHFPDELPCELARQTFELPELQSEFDQHCLNIAVSLTQRLIRAAASAADMADTADVADAVVVMSLRAEALPSKASSSRHATSQGDLCAAAIGSEAICTLTRLKLSRPWSAFQS